MKRAAEPGPGLRTLWALTWERGNGRRRLVVLGCLTSLLAPVFPLLQPLIVRDIVEGAGAERALLAPVLLLAAVTLSEAVFTGVQVYLLKRLAESTVVDTRQALIRRLLRLPVVEYDRRRLGDLISRLSTDTSLLRSVISNGVFDIISAVLLGAGSVVVLAFIDPLLLAVTLSSVLLAAVALWALMSSLRRISRTAQEHVGRMTAEFERALHGVRTIRVFDATEREYARVASRADDAYRAGLQLSRREAVVQPAVTTSIQIAIFMVLLVGGYRVSEGSMALGDLVAFLLYLFSVVLPLNQASRAITTVQVGLAAIDRSAEVLSIPTEQEAAEAARAAENASEARAALAGGRLRTAPAVITDDPGPHPLVEFRDVGFRYFGGPPVLSGTSFTVPRGSRTAVVGPSGGGKSTILALIARFYEPGSGTIRVDGQDIREMSHESLRARLSMVEQDAPVFAGSLRENLRLGAPDASEDALRSALRDVELGALLDHPDGLDRDLGDAGVVLSGGQRQRLAWARALLHDHELLLLDEPTSSVDAETEWSLQRLLSSCGIGTTTVMVAHRLATVVDSDQIIVLDGGGVAAVGTHESLLRDSPLYRTLAAYQGLVDDRTDPVRGLAAEPPSRAGAQGAYG
ncbi:ABC transporter ATP-binding protein [Streptomyces ficellus]|uniref:ABC transporter ATP-binding protein n=1 Tax=Streptomyces ficellus TaxID=1977088 RepID=A0ABT7Z3M1_9ACTN|nr:ABC transporter ATP-binding protein [Streptomyces ficellus]MDN3294089.1 ABC transporter ATP-binding protein [Streptomyces ficellus]